MNTTNNLNDNTVLNQDSTAEEYTKILRGRYVTGITISDDEIRTTTSPSTTATRSPLKATKAAWDA